MWDNYSTVHNAVRRLWSLAATSPDVQRTHHSRDSPCSRRPSLPDAGKAQLIPNPSVAVRRIAIALAACAAFCALPASAADYPTRPIQVLIPFATGGATQALSERVSRTPFRWSWASRWCRITTAAGAGRHCIAAEAAAHASAPDGYTLFMGAAGALAVAPAVMKAVRFNPLTDFQAIALIATTPYVVSDQRQAAVQEHARTDRVRQSSIQASSTSPARAPAAPTISPARCCKKWPASK